MSQINNLQQLNETINKLENKVENLEKENQNLWKWINYFDKDIVKGLPETHLLSKNFISRAFAVWGHYFIANSIITLILSIIMFIFYGAIIISLLQNAGLNGVSNPPHPILPTSTPWSIPGLP